MKNRRPSVILEATRPGNEASTLHASHMDCPGFRSGGYFQSSITHNIIAMPIAGLFVYM